MPQRLTRKQNASKDLRQDPRLKLPVYYTLIRVRTRGSDRYQWAGHIYDISASGMRFELDESLVPGTQVEVRATLPGSCPVTVRLIGHIVRIHDDDGCSGPVRMGMAFDRFVRPADYNRLMHYLAGNGMMAA